MVAVRPSEMMVSYRKTTRRHSPDDLNLSLQVMLVKKETTTTTLIGMENLSPFVAVFILLSYHGSCAIISCSVFTLYTRFESNLSRIQVLRFICFGLILNYMSSSSFED